MRKKILKYIEVAENIEKYIIRNHLKVGDKLPGGRYFTELFNTSKNTLYEAYGFLEDKNIISIEYKSGAVIKNIPRKSDKNLDCNPYIKLGWQRQSSRSFQKIYNQAFDKSFMFFNASHLHPDFGYGRLLEESVKNVMDRVRNTDLLSVCDNDIISSLKVEVAKRLDSVNYDKYCDNVLFCSGRYFAIDVVLQSLLCSGGILYVESPSHILSTSIMNSVGLNIVPVPMDSKGLSITELKRKYKKNKNAALFLSSRGNIVNNICLSHNRAKEILEFADNINMPVIEMDYNSIYYPNGAVLKKLDTNEANPIYLFNKWVRLNMGGYFLKSYVNT